MNKKSLSQKIFKPMLAIILVMSISILLIFNFTMKAYALDLAEKEINESLATIKTTLRNEVGDTNGLSVLERYTEITASLKNSLRLSRKVSDVQVGIMGNNGRLLIPRDTAASDEMLTISREVSSRIGEALTTDTFVIKNSNANYLVSFQLFNESKALDRRQYIILISSLAPTEQLTRRINIMLIGITLLISAMGLIATKKVASSVTKPIKSVSKYAKKLANGEYAVLNENADTIEMEALYRDLNVMAKHLKIKEQNKLDFIQNLSHDLRTPLMSIQGYAEGIMSGVFEEATVPAKIIANESIRLKKLVEQMITLSKLDNMEQPPLIESIEMFYFFNQMIERFEGFANKESVQLEVICEKNARFMADEELLDKAISNILSNAIKYATSKVQLTYSDNLIRIKDDGPGVPADIKENVFKRHHKGTDGDFGLGLAIAKSAVDLMGMQIEVENHAGAQFTIKKV